MTLLIVNDIVIEAQTMASDIGWEKYDIDEVLVAYSASEARAQILEHNVDILLSDIEMPDENGLSLIRWITENEYEIECILLTCHADFAYAKEGLSLGCQDYITLPAKYEDIEESIKKVCARHLQKQNDKKLQDYGKTWLASHSNSGESSESKQYGSAQIAEKCVEYILENISNPDLSVTSIADSLYLNPVHLNRVFKKEKKYNLVQWITKERMELAAKLLSEGNMPATNVALEVGYNNYPYFSTVFKKYYGVNPSLYNKNDPG